MTLKVMGMRMATHESKYSSDGEMVDCVSFTSVEFIVRVAADAAAAASDDTVDEDAVDSNGDDDVDMAVYFREVTIVDLVRKGQK